MSIEYAVKHCKGFGFRGDHEKIEPDSKYTIVVIGSEESRDKYNSSVLYFTSVDDFEERSDELSSKKIKLYIELGFIDNREVEVPNVLNESDFQKELDEFNTDEFPSGLISKYKDAILPFKRNPSYAIKQEFTADFTRFLELYYLYTNDGEVQHAILQSLSFNHRQTTRLSNKRSIVKTKEIREVVVRSKPFEDIPVKDPFIDEGVSIHSEDMVLRLRSGELNELNGLGTEFGLIGNAKRSASIASSHEHEIIDQLAQNQIVSIPIRPNHEKRLSCLRLIDTLTKFTNFRIIVIWPYQKTPVFSKEPSDVIRPSGKDGTVILNAFFFIITRTFFGMYKSKNNIDYMQEYLM